MIERVLRSSLHVHFILMKLKELVDEVLIIANEGKMDATDSTLFANIIGEAWDRIEGRKNTLWVDKEVVERNLYDWKQVSKILERIVEGCDDRGSSVSSEELKQLGRFYEGLRHTIDEFHRYSQTLTRKEGKGSMVRNPSILISEIGHDLDEIATGWSQKEDALIELGINDARRDLAELEEAIKEAED